MAHLPAPNGGIDVESGQPIASGLADRLPIRGKYPLITDDPLTNFSGR